VGVAIASPALLAAVGLGTDYAVFSMKVAELQEAADAAAIAGANELAISGSSDQSIISAAASYALAQNNSGLSHTTSQAEINRKRGTLKVTVEESWTPFFAHFLNAELTPTGNWWSMPQPPVSVLQIQILSLARSRNVSWKYWSMLASRETPARNVAKQAKERLTLLVVYHALIRRGAPRLQTGSASSIFSIGQNRLISQSYNRRKSINEAHYLTLFVTEVTRAISDWEKPFNNLIPCYT
jgi:Flp pilus assembly protein TadG